MENIQITFTYDSKSGKWSYLNPKSKLIDGGYDTFEGAARAANFIMFEQ